jgi:hypothetical protein
MNASKSLLLQVPFYRQASQFTCGPASLMMAMKFFQPSIHLNRGLELDIWRESNLVESYGTSKEGLAVAAVKRGFSAYTMGVSRRHSFVDEIADKIPNVDKEVLELLYNDTKMKFRNMGLENVNRTIVLPMLKTILKRSHIPILLTSTSLFGEKEALPHWVALTGYSEDAWYVNNPLAKSPNTPVDQARLAHGLGYQGVQCAVVVRGVTKRRKS